MYLSNLRWNNLFSLELVVIPQPIIDSGTIRITINCIFYITHVHEAFHNALINKIFYLDGAGEAKSLTMLVNWSTFSRPTWGLKKKLQCPLSHSRIEFMVILLCCRATERKLRYIKSLAFWKKSNSQHFYCGVKF